MIRNSRTHFSSVSSHALDTPQKTTTSCSTQITRITRTGRDRQYTKRFLQDYRNTRYTFATKNQKSKARDEQSISLLVCLVRSFVFSPQSLFMELSPYNQKEFIRWLRKKINLSLPQLVRYLSCTESQLKHMESGRHPVPDRVAQEVKAIARSMGVRVEDFENMYKNS